VLSKGEGSEKEAKKMTRYYLSTAKYFVSMGVFAGFGSMLQNWPGLRSKTSSSSRRR
jgi:hypothetical protein